MRDLEPPAIVRADELAELAAEINAECAAGDESSRRGLEHYRAAGLKLLQAKERCRYGTFLKWLAANVKVGQRQAYRYMALARLDSETNLEDAWRVLHGHDIYPDEPEDLIERPASSPSCDGQPSRADDPAAWDAPPPMFDGDGESQGMWNVPDPAAPAPQPPPSPPSPYVYSDRLARWLNAVLSEPAIIRVEKGGIRAILTERDKWDANRVKGYILPMLKELRKTIGELEKEIQNGFE